MKINRIKWREHPVLGNLELNFINKSTRKPYNTIIFVGENGTGKTTVLTSMSDFLNKYPMEYIEYIEYTINNDVYKAIPPADESLINSGYYDVVQSDGKRLQMHTGKNHKGVLLRESEKIDNDPLNIRYYGCFYSKAKADYKAKRIASITTKQLDDSKQDIDKEEDYTSLKQLLVDIGWQDYKEYAVRNQSLGSDPKS